MWSRSTSCSAIMVRRNEVVGPRWGDPVHDERQPRIRRRDKSARTVGARRWQAAGGSNPLLRALANTHPCDARAVAGMLRRSGSDVMRPTASVAHQAPDGAQLQSEHAHRRCQFEELTQIPKCFVVRLVADEVTENAETRFAGIHRLTEPPRWPFRCVSTGVPLPASARVDGRLTARVTERPCRIPAPDASAWTWEFATLSSVSAPLQARRGGSTFTLADPAADESRRQRGSAPTSPIAPHP